MRGLAIAFVLLAARAGHAEPPGSSDRRASELDARNAFGLGFGMGGLELGDTGGLLDPQLRARYALLSPPFELEVTGDWSNWFDARGDQHDPNEPRRLVRAGTALRWDFALPEHANPNVALIAWLDAGMGWEHASSATASADRGDLQVGAGMGNLFLWSGHARAAFTLSIHLVAAPATDGFAQVACHAVCAPTGRGVDLGGGFQLGFELRR